MPHLLEALTLNVCVVSGKVNCWHYILAGPTDSEEEQVVWQTIWEAPRELQPRL